METRTARTDLPNLVLLCKHHHGLVHRLVWTMSGNANEELTFVGPGGRVMTSRPSSNLDQGHGWALTIGRVG